MATEIRLLTPDDAAAVHALATEAFALDRPPRSPWPAAGDRVWGAVRGAAVVAVVAMHSFASWFGGCRVPTAGVAGVTVRAEERGAGLLRPLLGAATADARDHGAVLSTMFPAAPAMYRGLGWELVGEFTEVALPLTALARIGPVDAVTLHRAEGPEGAEAAAAVYDRWAAAQDGPLTRRSPAGPAVPEGYALTLARDTDGATVGYARWQHGPNPAAGRDGQLRSAVGVRELVALTGPAGAALWRAVGSFAGVSDTARVWTSGADATRLALPGAQWRPVTQWPYGLRLLDVAGALAARGVGPAEVELPFSVTGDGLDGRWTLAAAGGRATCAPGGAGGPVFAARGLALAFAGVQSCANLRFAGLLDGPDADDARWDALLGGRPFHVRDYF